jgi:hypothetical protein
MFNKPKENVCPFLGQECIGSQCKLWGRVSGVHPQTGQVVEQHDCTLVWIPMLLTNVVKETSQNTAATNEVRNELQEVTNELQTAKQGIGLILANYLNQNQNQNLIK